MRIWLRPDRLASLRLTATDVANAILEQNVQAPAGQVGQPPAGKDQSFQYSLRVRGRLVDPEEFANIIVGSRPDGSFVRIRDVGRVELGGKDYNYRTQFRGRPAVLMAISLAPGANAMQTAALVKRELASMRSSVPERPRLQGHVRHLGLRQRFDRGGHSYVHRSAAAGAGRRLPVPAELARDADPDARRAGVADRDVRRLPGARLLDQYAVAVRHGARDRHRRRRCHRRRRSGRAEHACSQALAARSDPQGDGRGAGTGGRNCAGTGRGVRADGVHSGRDWAALQAVRADDRGRDVVLGARCADVDAGAVHATAAAGRARGRGRAAQLPAALLPWFQPQLRPPQRSLHRSDQSRRPATVPARDHTRHRDCNDPRSAAHHADRLRARRGQGRGLHADHPARSRLAAAHAERSRAGREDRRQPARRRRDGGRRGLRPDFGHGGLELRPGGRASQALGRALVRRACAEDSGSVDGPHAAHPGGGDLRVQPARPARVRRDLRFLGDARIARQRHARGVGAGCTAVPRGRAAGSGNRPRDDDLLRGDTQLSAQRRSREGEEARCAGQRRVHDVPDVHGRLPGQRVHRVRPQLQGHDPGRYGVSPGSPRHRPLVRAQRAGRHGAARRGDDVRTGDGRAFSAEIQPVSHRRSERDAGARRQFRPGDRRDRARCGHDAAAGLPDRVDRSEPAGEAGRQHRGNRHGALGRRGVPVPRGTVRKLDGAAGGAARNSVRVHGRVARTQARRHRVQRIRADRSRDADRAVGQERDPDRRVREAESRSRQAADRVGGRGREAAPAPDPDDFVRIHTGRRAARRSHRAPAPRRSIRSASRCSAA